MTWRIIGNKEIEFIQYGLKQQNKIESLTGNVADFGKGFIKSQSLVEVKLGGNPLTPDDIDVLINSFKRKSVLRTLSLGDYKWLTKEQTAVTYIFICVSVVFVSIVDNYFNYMALRFYFLTT